MNQKGFIKILIIAIAVIIIGTIGYFTLVKKPPTTPSPEGQGAYIPSEEEIIRVLFPKGGETLEIGKTYEIRWENYIGKEPINIVLAVIMPDGKSWGKIIAENVPSATSGTYQWTVTSEPLDSKYKIEVYPPGNRPLVGRSKGLFSITGDSLIMVNTPQPLEKVTASIKITGKARRIFSEGEFIVRLREVGSVWDEAKGLFVKFPAITEAIARGGECWMTGDWCDFTAELSFSSEEIKDRGAMIEFYKRDERFGEKLIYEFPITGERTPLGYGFLEISAPLLNQEVSSPIVITGKAKGIFFDGRFRIALWAQDYPYGHPKGGESRLIDSTYATITDDCDWSVGKWCNFRAEINYQSSEIGKIGNSLNFYRGGKGELGEGFLLTWPIKLK